MKKSIAIIAFGDTGAEPEALRQAAECFGYFVVKFGIGRPQDFMDILAGRTEIPFDMIILSGHGCDGKIIMPQLCEDIYFPHEPRGDFGGFQISQHLALQNTCIVSLCCDTGSSNMARAFTRKGNTYIAPTDDVEGNSALAYALQLLYHAAQNGFDIQAAHAKAAAMDAEAALFVLHEAQPPKVIHIMGASGAGTSTLGRALEARHGYKWMDTDGYFWAQTDPPYEQSLPREERLRLMRAAMDQHPRCVISGALCGWGDALIPRFDLVVWLQAPTEVRLERLRQREREAFGARVLPGGDMHENHEAFLLWAAGYDTGDESMRSFAQHEKWVRGLDCPVMILDGTKPVEELAALIWRG